MPAQVAEFDTDADAGSHLDDHDADHFTGVLVIHGIGEERRNAMLEEALNAITYWFNHVAGLAQRPNGPGRVWVTSHLTDDPNPDAPAARATMELVAPGPPEARSTGDSTLRLEFREVWWAESIGLPSVGATIRWTRVQFREQAANLLLLFRRQQGRTRDYTRPRAGAVTTGGARTKLTWPERALLIAVLWLYGLMQYVWKALQWLILAPLGFLLLLVMGLIRLLAVLPPLRSTIVSSLSALLDRIMLHWIAEAEVYTLDYTRSSAIRERFARELDAFLSNQRCDRIVILAHSMGNVIAYEGLTTAFARPEIRDNRKRITFICLAQSLRRLWLMTADDPHRMRGVLPENVDWVHFWARYDPVAAGPLSARSLPVLDPWPDTSVPDPQPKLRARLDSCENVKVVNTDSTFTDHSTYYQNLEQVVGPIAYELTAGHDALHAYVGAHLPTSDQLLLRRGSVAWRATVSLLGGLAAGAAVLFANVQSGGAVGVAIWQFITSQQTRAFLIALITGQPFGTLLTTLQNLASLRAGFFSHLPANPATVVVWLASLLSQWVVQHRNALVTYGAALLAAGVGMLVVGQLVAMPSPFVYAPPHAAARRGARAALTLGLFALALCVLAYYTSPPGYDPFLAFELSIRSIVFGEGARYTFVPTPPPFVPGWNAATGAVFTSIAAWLVGLIDAVWTRRWSWAAYLFIVPGLAIAAPVTGLLFYTLLVLTLLYGLFPRAYLVWVLSPLAWIARPVRKRPESKDASSK